VFGISNYMKKLGKSALVGLVLGASSLFSSCVEVNCYENGKKFSGKIQPLNDSTLVLPLNIEDSVRRENMLIVYEMNKGDYVFYRDKDNDSIPEYIHMIGRKDSTLTARDSVLYNADRYKSLLKEIDAAEEREMKIRYLLRGGDDEKN